MSTLALVRAEIKGWERDFASTHGRDPSLQDIRDHPFIADRYKLYKKLSRAAANPSTPPRTHSQLPKSRTAEPVPPLSGFNPFSPVKKTARRNPIVPRSSPRPNLFATPTKNNSKHGLQASTTSPDLFPTILPPHQSVAAASSRAYPIPTSAISRARKRLRGEPVSPSPNKPKRQRTRTPAQPPFPKLEQDSSNSDQELPHCDFTPSFVADSPVKAPAGGKSFRLLFNDTLPALSVAKKPVASSPVHFDSPPEYDSSRGPPVDLSLSLHNDPRSKDVASRPRHRVNRVQDKIPIQIFPTRDRLPASSHKPTFKTAVSEMSQTRISIKRPLRGEDLVLERVGPNTPLHPQLPLVPPSPPQDLGNRDVGKGRMKPTVSRKKPRVDDEESDEEMDSTNDITLKIATVSQGRAKHSCRHDDDLDWDPLPYLGTPNRDPAAIDANHHVSGTFIVDLPDKFRRVLAISPSRCQNSTEERVVRGLLYGDRVGHYDPSRGGDIWDAGETDEGTQGDVETEDDWEREPVPWEVGEL